MRIPSHSLIVNSQFASYRLVELLFTTHRLPEPQLVTQKLLGSHFPDTQLPHLDIVLVFN